MDIQDKFLIRGQGRFRPATWIVSRTHMPVEQNGVCLRFTMLHRSEKLRVYLTPLEARTLGQELLHHGGE